VKFYSASHEISGRFSLRINNLKDYLSLHNENRKLTEENAALYNRLTTSYSSSLADTTLIGDSLHPRKFLYYSARIINNTVSKQYNYLTLDKGSTGGIAPDMAVISSDGIVGVVSSVSQNYATVLSVLNRDFTVSGKILKNGYFGPVSWVGNSTDIITLVDIPHHVQISKGDTIVTSGYGGVFPEGYLIGTISKFRLKGGNYYEIDIKLSNDFRRLTEVQVIRNLAKQEIDSVENAVNQ
jgi:rod shape-determining protein MreC